MILPFLKNSASALSRACVSVAVAIVFALAGNPAAAGAVSLDHTFTTCGASGSSGPSVGACRAAYSTDWDESDSNFGVNGGIQQWRVPATGVYRITAAGARGGYGGGLGALITADVSLTADTWISILAGQQGGTSAINLSGTFSYLSGTSGGGGGGTFVTSAAGTPLVIAGGGGGNSDRSFSGISGQTGTAGSQGQTYAFSGWWAYYGANTGGLPTDQAPGGAGGTGGGGGGYAPGSGEGACYDSYFTNGDHPKSDCHGGGGGGGGYSGGGAARPGVSAGGSAFTTGGSGGGEGGFGGGGATGRFWVSAPWEQAGYRGWFMGGGGGGGGYSGGGGGAGGYEYYGQKLNASGGGGGSYWSGSAANVSASSTNAGDGYVTITSLAPSAPQITSAPDALSGPRGTNVSFSGDPGVSFSCSLNGTDWTSCSSPFHLSGDVDGAVVTAHIKAVSSEGYESEAVTASTTMDLTGPAAPTVYGVPSGATTQSGFRLTFDGVADAFTECLTDESSWFQCWSPNDFWGYGEGPHTLRVRQTDELGNVGASSDHSWTVDVTPPADPVIVAAPTGYQPSRSASVEFSGDSDAGFRCQINGGDWNPCSSPLALTDLADGDMLVKVRAVDAAGNESAGTASATWRVDATPPAQPVVTSPASGSLTSSRSTPFAATASGGAVLMCSLDGGAYSLCPAASSGAPGDLSRVDVGWNTKLHWGEDADWTSLAWGQTNPSGSVQWNGGWLRGDFTTYLGSDDVSLSSIVKLVSRGFGINLGCEYIRGIGQSMGIFIVAGVPDHSKYNSYNLDCDGALAEFTARSASFDDLAEGVHTVSVKAVTASGNESPVSTSSWTVDTTGPAAPMIAGGPASTTNATSAAFTFLGEAGAVFECSVDGAGFEACGGSSKVLSDLDAGDHSLSVRSVDAAGNVGAASTRSWTVQPLVVTAPALAPTPDPLNVTSKLTASGWSVSGALTTATPSLRWQRCAAGDSIDCSDIPASESPTLNSWTTKVLDIGRRLRIRVSYTTPEGVTATAYSQLSAVVRPVAKSVAITTLGAGRTAPGTGVAVTAGSVSSTGWVAGESVLNWQWERCSTVQSRKKKAPKKRLAREDLSYSCSAIPGATTASYKPSNADVGQVLRAGVSVTTRGASSGVAYSAYTQRTVDITAPVAPTIASAPALLTNSTGGSFGFSGEPGGSFECALDGAAFASCASPKAVTGLSDGEHSFRVRQTDAAGNTGPAATRTWTVRVIQVTPPVLDVPAADPVGAGSVITGSDWSQTGALSVSSVSLKWQRCEIVEGSQPACIDITGGNSTTGSSWTAGTADVGYLLRLKVTYKTSTGVTATGYSDASGLVSPALKTTPLLSLGTGRVTPRRGTAITTTRAAAWVGWITGLSTETRQWERCTSTQASSCTAISGATRSWYAPQTADLGKYLRLRVTAKTRTAETSVWTDITPAVTAN